MSSDEPPSEPRSCLLPAIAAVRTGDQLDPTLVSILEIALAGLRADGGATFLQDPDRPVLTLAATAGLDDVASAALAGEAQRPEHPLAIAVADRLAVFDRVTTTEAGRSTTAAYLPLTVSTGNVETVLGVLSLSWDGERRLDQVERETLAGLAGIAALAVDRARLGSTAAERSEWFERMAHTDPLTGLANDRTIGRVLELEIARAARQGTEVSLAVFDVDDFRATNADGGHEVGDAVLRQVASVLAGAVRLVDTVGRIGGDEFVLIAPGPAGLMVSRRILDGIAALPAVDGRQVSVSAGVARFPGDGEEADGLIHSAMEALARAKGDGRGSVSSSDPLDPSPAGASADI